MKVTARATRSGRWWAVEVPEVPGVFTQARRLDQVAGMAADAIATMLRIDPAELEVTLEPSVADEALQAAVTDAVSATAEAMSAQRMASERMRAAVVALRDEEFTARDVAMLLGVTHQRVSQLEKSAR